MIRVQLFLVATQSLVSFVYGGAILRCLVALDFKTKLFAGDFDL